MFLLLQKAFASKNALMDPPALEVGVIHYPSPVQLQATNAMAAPFPIIHLVVTHTYHRLSLR
jgi:hypothetical protein